MAQFVGIDLGSYSVKAVVIDLRFRDLQLKGAFEKPLEAEVPPRPAPAGDATQATELPAQLERATRTLERLIQSKGIKVEAGGITALPGERVTIRQLELPFGDLRKVTRVVALELESQIPFDIDEVVHGHVVLDRSPQRTQLVAAAAPRDEVRRVLLGLERIGIEPRTVAAGPLAYAPLLRRLMPEGDPTAVVDIGHLRTQICVIGKGKPLFARCIGRGGADVTRALARELNLPSTEAEAYKHGQAMVAGSQATFPSHEHARSAEICRQAMAPLVRELRQTLASLRAQGTFVNRLLLCGGGSQLKGLLGYLGGELEQPVDPLVCDLPGLKALAKTPSLALATSLALGGAAGRGALCDLRQDDLVYRGETSALRTRLPQLGAWAGVLVLCLGINAWASYRSLSQQGEQLDERLEKETKALFGSARTDAANILKELKKQGKEQNPVPDVTAFDLLNQMSKALPDKEKTKLDVVELEIKPKKTFIRGTAESHSDVEDVVTALKTIPCFEEVKQGRTQDVGKVKEFTLDIRSRCP
jgi:general secretion pathway protein L